MDRDNRLPNMVRPVPANLPSDPYILGEDFDAAPGREFELREYLRILYAHRVLIGTVTTVMFLFSVVYAFTATPTYTASAKIKISSYEPILAATKIEDMLQQKSKEAHYLETQIQQIKSFSLADRVLQDSTIREGLKTESGGGFLALLFGSDSADEPELTVADPVSGYSSDVPAIRSYLDRISVKPIRRTSLVVLEASSSKPKLAAQIANRHADQYIEWVREGRVTQQSRGLTFLKGQADELRQKVADLERELADYAEANSIVAVNKDENITAQRMSQLNKMLTEATARRLEAEHMYEEARRGLKSSSAGVDDASIYTMRSELSKLESEYKLLGAKFTPSYPRMKQLKSQIESIKKNISGQRSQVVAGLKAKSLAIADEEKSLREELEKQKSLAFELSKRQVHYNILSRELQSSRELLQNVLRQIKETSLTVEGNSSNVAFVDRAAIPLSPSAPRKKLIVLMGLALGLFSGIALSFLLSYLDDSVRTPEQLVQSTGIPTLGVVPSFELEALPAGAAAKAAGRAKAGQDIQGSGTTGSQAPTVMKSSAMPSPIMYLTDPRSLASEAYRTIRTGILLSQAGEPPRTILVSSAQSSEGKTTSAINLAASLASAGGRVALIDADLRRPSLLKTFSEERDLPGVVEIITGQATIEEVSLDHFVRRITLIPSGKIPPNPAELLGSIEMASLIDALAARYDYVIIDSPPVLPVADSVILSRYVDGVILVVKGAATPRKVVSDAKARLAAVGAKFLGAVLNDVDITGGDYHYYNRYYYSYYQSEDDKDSRAA